MLGTDRHQAQGRLPAHSRIHLFVWRCLSERWHVHQPSLQRPRASQQYLAALPDALAPELNPKENLWDEIREKIFKNYALKSIDAVRAKLKEAM